MNSNNDISEELNMLAPSLIGLRGKQVFTVPEGYFQQFSDSVTNLVTDELIINAPFPAMEVPEGYFDTFSSKILALVKEEYLEELPPALSLTGNDNVFTVPRNYFNDLPSIILSSVSEEPAKVVKMNFRSVARYATAAVVTGLLGLSLFTVFDTGKRQDDMAKIISEGMKIMESNQFEQVMQTVPADAIVSYLEQSGQDVDAALVATTTDRGDLPAPEDYLLDEKTLDNFLDELNINELN